MAAPREIVELVERFERNLDEYRSGRYNETKLRRDFIDPFFKALGWDVANTAGSSELYRDVVHEDSVKVRGSTKAPDYAFRIGGARKFFVEAKKPSVNLENDVRASFQLRSYAWSAGLPISLLTDFEEFSIYDCRIEPANTDSPRVGLLCHFTYDKYVDHWDEIATLFSREAVLGGSLERYIESKKKARGTIAVDEAFLREIDSWREILAKNVHRNNPYLTVRELNSSVQNTIDRIVFLRICEDRGIERFGQLKGLLKGEMAVYARLVELFKEADERYNSGLFHFGDDPGRIGEPDRLALALKIDDSALAEMIENLYPPRSPYRFSVIPAEILGHVYEQFLGKVISLGEDGGVEVEYKPEVRKAGGVYYTPTYIVDYIVENTVGKLLAGQTPTTVSELRILDPACGSGSFLIGAYQRLLDWHLEWYTRHLVPHLAAGKAESSREVLALLPPGGLAGANANAGAGAGAGAVGNAAGAAKRRGRGRPRKNSAAASPSASASATNGQRAGSFPIFQAAGGEWRLATAERKRILLNNIYGVDIDLAAVEVTKLSLQLKVLEGENRETLSQQLTLFKERALPDLGENIKCGNSLIGPDFYDRQTSLFDEEEMYRVNAFDWEAEFPEIMGRGGFDAVIGNPPYGIVFEDAIKFYLEQHYPTFRRNNDYYVAFTHKCLELMKFSGIFGFIIPNTFLLGPYFDHIKAYILNNSKILRIVDFGTNQVFKDPNVFTGLIFLQKVMNPLNNPEQTCFIKVSEISSFPSDASCQFVDRISLESLRWSPENSVMSKMFEVNIRLDNIAWIKDVGLNYWTKGRGKTRGGSIADRVLYVGEQEHPEDLPYLKGRDINKYSLIFSNHWLRHDYQERLDAGVDTFRFSPEYLEQNKIIYRQTADRIIATLEMNKTLTDKTLHSIILKDTWKNKIDLSYLLGLLNSKLMTYLYKAMSLEEGRVFAQVKVFRIKQLPIIIAASDNYDKMVKLVENMLDLHRRLSESKTGHEKTLLSRQIEATDRQIDALVYELYGLSEEEIAIVEDAAR